MSKKGLRINDHEDVVDSVESFYRECDGLWLPESSSWRHFRVECVGETGYVGRWIKVKDRINDVSDLREWLVDLSPLNVYYGVAYWGNPSVVGKRGGLTSNNLFMFSDFVVDVDRFDVEGVLAMYDYLDTLFSEKNVWLKVSGGGFHITVDRFFENTAKISDPGRREMLCEVKMEKLVDELVNEGFVFDYHASMDTRRIVRLPGTLHRTGWRCRRVSYNEVSGLEGGSREDVLSALTDRPVEIDVKEESRGMNAKKLCDALGIGLDEVVGRG